MRIIISLLALVAALGTPRSPLAQTYCPDTYWARLSPAVSFGRLNDVYGISATNVYAVGADGVILHFNGLEWSPMNSPTAQELTAVWGSSGSDVYAAGKAGTVLRFDGPEWTELAGPGGASPDFVDMYGGGGAIYLTAGTGIYRADATHWWLDRTLTCDITVSGSCSTVGGAWVSPAGNPCLVGQYHLYEPALYYGYVFGTGGGTYTPTAKFYSVWGAASDDIYALGTPEYWTQDPWFQVYHSSGGIFTALAAQPAVRLRMINGATATDIFGIDADENLVHYDGATWSVAGPPGFSAASLWGSSGSDIHIVGTGLIAHYDGSDFEVLSGTSTIGAVALNDVWAVSGSDAYAAGGTPGMFHYDGTGWSAVAGFNDSLCGVWASSPNDIHAVGANGAAWRYDGAVWTRSALGTATLNDVHGSSASDVYAVGRENGNTAVQHFDGASWLPVGSLIDGQLGSNAQAVFVAPGGDLFIGNDAGTVLRHDGAGVWTGIPGVLSSGAVRAIWGPSPSALFVAGDGVTVARVDGAAGTVTGTWALAHGGVNALWGTSATDVWAATDGGAVFHFDGAAWVWDRQDDTGADLRGLHGLGTCDLFAVGTGATVLRLESPATTTDITTTPPAESALRQNYPNPFNPWTVIPFDIHTGGHVELTIYDVTGHRVRTLVDAYRPASSYLEEWTGDNDAGQPVATGVYLYRLRVNGSAFTRKMILIR